MQFREKVFYNSDGQTEQVFVPMSPVKFKERYGVTFKEWKAGLAKNDYRKQFKFNECYVDDDPYDSDICGETNPIIERTPEDLNEAVISSAYEI